MPPGGRGAAELCPVDRQTTGGCGVGSRVCERWRPDALGQPARAKWTPREPYAVKYWQIGNEVEYVNGGAQTRWGSLRARNGHPGSPARAKWTPREPYAVKYWQIGNEVGGKDYERS